MIVLSGKKFSKKVKEKFSTAKQKVKEKGGKAKDYFSNLKQKAKKKGGKVKERFSIAKQKAKQRGRKLKENFIGAKQKAESKVGQLKEDIFEYYKERKERKVEVKKKNAKAKEKGGGLWASIKNLFTGAKVKIASKFDKKTPQGHYFSLTGYIDAKKTKIPYEHRRDYRQKAHEYYENNSHDKQ